MVLDRDEIAPEIRAPKSPGPIQTKEQIEDAWNKIVQDSEKYIGQPVLLINQRTQSVGRHMFPEENNEEDYIVQETRTISLLENKISIENTGHRMVTIPSSQHAVKTRHDLWELKREPIKLFCFDTNAPQIELTQENELHCCDQGILFYFGQEEIEKRAMNRLYPGKISDSSIFLALRLLGKAELVSPRFKEAYRESMRLEGERMIRSLELLRNDETKSTGELEQLAIKAGASNRVSEQDGDRHYSRSLAEAQAPHNRELEFTRKKIVECLENARNRAILELDITKDVAGRTEYISELLKTYCKSYGVKI